MQEKFKRFTVATLLCVAFGLVPFSPFADDAGDPMNSPLWPYLKTKYFPEIGEIRHSAKIRVFTPEFAENPVRVPVSVNADELGDVRQMIVLADLNPIQKIIEFKPGELFRPSFSFYFKIQQRSPLRVLAQTADGKWHMNGNWIEATGGGCTVPSAHAAGVDWSEVGQARGMISGSPEQGLKLKMSVVHPMDTGLVSGIPEFYVEKMIFSDEKLPGATGDLLLYQPISQDPLISLSLLKGVESEAIDVAVRDSSGQVFRAKFNQAPNLF